MVNRTEMIRAAEALLAEATNDGERAAARAALDRLNGNGDDTTNPGRKGLLNNPEAFGFILIGQVDWTIDRWDYEATWVFVETDREAFHVLTAYGEYDDIEDMMSETDIETLTAVGTVADLNTHMEALITEKTNRPSYFNVNPTAAEEARRLVVWAHDGQKAL